MRGIKARFWLGVAGTLFVLTVGLPLLAISQPQDNPAAHRLMEEARAKRATWGKTFPGFTTELSVNYNGQRHTGTVAVSSTGKVTLTMPEGPAKEWATRTLTSIGLHRLGRREGKAEPKLVLRFGPEDYHPLGRLVLSNDEMHSSFRIHDQQILQVNRTMKETKFSIAVLENTVNASGHYLPRCFVVSYFDPENGALIKTEAFRDTFERVGAFDLPRSRQVVRAQKRGGVEAFMLELSQHRLSHEQAEEPSGAKEQKKAE